MRGVTTEQIRRATSFVLSDNTYFNSDTKVGVPYKLYVDVEGVVFHLDSAGFRREHVLEDGTLTAPIKAAIENGHIKYSFLNETPRMFDIDTKEKVGKDTYSVRIYTDSIGLKYIEEMKKQVQLGELEELKQQRREIQQRIDELEKLLS